MADFEAFMEEHTTESAEASPEFSQVLALAGESYVR
jgi:hypothetical protein